MLTNYSDVVIDSAGNGLAGVMVSVTIAGTDTAAVLYTDRAGISPIVGNAITTGSAPPGAFSFYVPEGHFDLTFTLAGVVIATRLNVYVPSSSVPAVNPLRFFTAAQLADVLAGTVQVDCSSGLQACIDYAQANDKAVDLQGFKYRIGQTLNWKHGRNSTTDTKTYTVNIIGNGATLYPAAGVYPISIVPRCTLADKASGRGDAVIKIRDITIDGFLSPGSAKAIRIGAAGFICSAFEWSDVDGFTIQGFSDGNTVGLITDTRHIDFERFTVRAGTIAITSGTTGAFCGDFVFRACEFKGTEASPPLNITCTGGQVRGITFSATDIYGAGALISVSGSGAQVGDIWFDDGCQFDGPDAAVGERALILQATAGGQLFQIHSKGSYFVGYRGAVVDATTATGGSVRILSIEGGGVNDCTGDAGSNNAIMNFEALEQVAVRGVGFDNCVATSLINFDGCEHVVAHDNQAVNCASTTNGISVGNGDNHSIVGNVMQVGTDVVNDYTTGSPTRQVANNLKTTA